jgi:hypothetical protein
MVRKAQVVLTKHKIKFSRYDFRPNDGPKEKKKLKGGSG